jgi:hypothetical protein
LTEAGFPGDSERARAKREVIVDLDGPGIMTAP